MRCNMSDTIPLIEWTHRMVLWIRVGVRVRWMVMAWLLQSEWSPLHSPSKTFVSPADVGAAARITTHGRRVQLLEIEETGARQWKWWSGRWARTTTACVSTQ